MPPDAEDASSPSSAEQSGDQDTGDMAEHLETRADSDDSPKPQPNNGQKAPSSAKDPSRPRRKKARRACFACQRAHLTCGKLTICYTRCSPFNLPPLTIHDYNSADHPISTGDERPCQRCIKRGLQDACQDGVRKKAKYLHDAPDGALMPGVGGHYPNISNDNPPVPGNNGLNTGPLGPQSQYFPQAQAGGYAIYPHSTNNQNMPPPLQEIPLVNQFNAQQSPLSSQFSSNQSQQTSPMQGLNSGSQPSQQYTDALFDPSDPGLFNFDLASLNFGNHYGALEFGMLGHMSSAVDTPQSEGGLIPNVNQPQSASGNFSATATSVPSYPNASGQRPDFMYVQDTPMTDWQSQQDSTQGNGGMLYNPMEALARSDSHNALPRAFVIGAGPSSLPSGSPASTVQDSMMYDTTAPMSPSLFVNSPSQQQHLYNRQNPQHQQAQRGSQSGPASQSQGVPQQEKHVTLPKNMRLPTATALTDVRKRDRDPSSIYSSVTAPYAYTNSFHGLINVLLKRLPKQKVVRIAECMSYFRPTFIACTRTLNRQDLIFMEQGFQRMLWEYEDFINAYGTPSIICRRTGEVVGVNKEFSLLTGWSRDVLLGNEKNLNVNTGREDGANSRGAEIGSGSSRGGFNTPRGPPSSNPNNRPSSVGGDHANGGAADGGGAAANGESRHQPVYIAELLDDDSIIRFYEDFSMLAFGDSRGSVMNPCKLLKYRSEQDSTEENEAEMKVELGDRIASAKDARQRTGVAGGKGNKSMSLQLAHSIHNEAGMHALGKREGKVDCMYCWTTRRDVWDMPMLIVMNVSLHPLQHG